MPKIKTIFGNIGEETAGDHRDQAEEPHLLGHPCAILRYIQPPFETEQIDPSLNGFYQIETPSFVEGRHFRYLVQLPPEYDPNRKYPTIVTLHSERTTPEIQIDWWAGPWKEKKSKDGTVIKERFGQGTRFGYIVIAPAGRRRKHLPRYRGRNGSCSVRPA